jgi:hypothetical protein
MSIIAKTGMEKMVDKNFIENYLSKRVYVKTNKLQTDFKDFGLLLSFFLLLCCEHWNVDVGLEKMTTLDQTLKDMVDGMISLKMLTKPVRCHLLLRPFSDLTILLLVASSL